MSYYNDKVNQLWDEWIAKPADHAGDAKPKSKPAKARKRRAAKIAKGKSGG